MLFAVLVFTACAEYFFWEEFETRFDFVAVDYLVYQREVTDNIRQSYPLGIIFPAIGMAAFLFFGAVKRLYRPLPAATCSLEAPGSSRLHASVAAPVLAQSLSTALSAEYPATGSTIILP